MPSSSRPAPSKATSKGTAYFDLDGTLVDRNSSFAFGQFLYRQSVFTSSTMLRLLLAYVRFRWMGKSLNYVHQKCFDLLFKGRSFDLLSVYAQQFAHDFVGPATNPAALAVLKRHQAAGDRVVILSSSPALLVGPIAQILGVSEWVGTEYSVDKSGSLDAISSLVCGQFKADYVARHHGDVGQAGLSYGYSDSIVDLPFLEAVAVPNLVRPDKLLAKIGRKRHWQEVGAV